MKHNKYPKQGSQQWGACLVCRSNEFEVVDDNSNTSSRYSVPKRRRRSGLRITDGDLKAKACFGTWEETSNCGSTIALFTTKPSIVDLLGKLSRQLHPYYQLDGHSDQGGEHSIGLGFEVTQVQFDSVRVNGHSIGGDGHSGRNWEVSGFLGY